MGILYVVTRRGAEWPISTVPAICMMTVWNSAFLSTEERPQYVLCICTVQNWIALDLSVPKTHSDALVVQYSTK